ncbi:MAG: flagellin [Clostridiales bacterium]|nr:flagellin [Clostridiales bacterium]
MRINHNISALNTNRQMMVNHNAASKSMEKLSSGLRINRAADDAAGLSISEKMRAQIRSLEQATRNAQDGISFIQTAEGALNEVSDMLGRMKELKVQSANGTYDTTDTGNIDLELEALGAAIDKILTDTSFNGKNMLKSDFEGVSITDDAGAAIVSISKITFAGGLDEASTIAEIDTAIENVNKDRAQFGAYQNQLEHTINNLSTTTENLTSSESRIRDVDMAMEMTEFTKNSILLQASQAMLAQANSQPQNILQLLR